MFEPSPFLASLAYCTIERSQKFQILCVCVLTSTESFSVCSLINVISFCVCLLWSLQGHVVDSDYVAVCDPSVLLIPQYDILPVRHGATFVVNCGWTAAQLEAYVPPSPFCDHVRNEIMHVVPRLRRSLGLRPTVRQHAWRHSAPLCLPRLTQSKRLLSINHNQVPPIGA